MGGNKNIIKRKVLDNSIRERQTYSTVYICNVTEISVVDWHMQMTNFSYHSYLSSLISDEFLILISIARVMHLDKSFHCLRSLCFVTHVVSK